ncbi:Hypothetical protein BQ3484_420 [Cedratvirus A11]|uniref:Uncharacterized protein n=1 Tax=Cedratvirus A11 TaxID=1903266 RepID=A0A1M7XVC6_9VIRU|nr:Hypothetical protein BQ3484_420 [Cedratvirus A11]SHO33488.1 Hypothetical protein BQ3484_420 [Cedratvirus A11]
MDSVNDESKMAFVSVQTTFRNDGGGERSVQFKVFTDKDEAVKHTMEEMGIDEEDKEKVSAFLHDGGGVWIPEWERKGNGDEYFVIETNNPERYSYEAQQFVNEEFSALELTFDKSYYGGRRCERLEDI